MASVTNMLYPGGNIAEVIMAETVEALLIPAAYAFPVAAPLVRTRDLRGVPTRTHEFPKWPVLTAAAVNNNVDLTNTDVDTTSVSITAGEVGIMVNVGDSLSGAQVMSAEQMQVVAQILPIPPAAAGMLARLMPYADELARSVLVKMDTDIIAEAANAGASAGTTGSDAQMDDFIDGIYNLEVNNAPKPYHSILHPIQLRDLRVDVLGNATTAFSLIPDEIKAALINANTDGFVTNLMGVMLYQSTLCAAVNAAADRQGLIMPASLDAIRSTSPIGLVLKQVLRVELERDASLRSTEIVVIADYGVATINSTWLVDITTDHE